MIETSIFCSLYFLQSGMYALSALFPPSLALMLAIQGIIWAAKPDYQLEQVKGKVGLYSLQHLHRCRCMWLIPHTLFYLPKLYNVVKL